MTKYLLGALLLAILFAGCGSTNEVLNQGGPGFWNGLWDGITAPLAFFGDLLGIGDWGIYSVHNNGRWYDFGFMLGIGGFGCGCGAARHD